MARDIGGNDTYATVDFKFLSASDSELPVTEVEILIPREQPDYSAVTSIYGPEATMATVPWAQMNDFSLTTQTPRRAVNGYVKKMLQIAIEESDHAGAGGRVHVRNVTPENIEALYEAGMRPVFDALDIMLGILEARQQGRALPTMNWNALNPLEAAIRERDKAKIQAFLEKHRVNMYLPPQSISKLRSAKPIVSNMKLSPMIEEFIREVRHKSLMNPKKPLLGQLPKEMRQEFPDAKPSELIHGLNQLGRMLGEIVPLVPGPKFRLPEFSVLLGGERIHVEYVGSGGWASVYKLSIGDQSYAFRVYYDRVDNGIGAYSDLAAGLFYTRHGITKDMVKTYAGNYQDRWVLAEFLDETTDINNREGMTLAEARFKFSAEKDSFEVNPQNYRNHVRQDLGGGTHETEEYFNDHWWLASKYRAVNELEYINTEPALLTVMLLEGQIKKRLPDPEAEEALKEITLLKHKTVLSLILNGPIDLKRKLYAYALQDKSVRKDLALHEELFLSPDLELREMALNEAIKYPEGRRLIVVMADKWANQPGIYPDSDKESMPMDFIRDIFDTAYESPDTHGLHTILWPDEDYLVGFADDYYPELRLEEVQ